jgi:hypothetical protein
VSVEVSLQRQNADCRLVVGCGQEVRPTSF